jgi:surfactin synthase thioesterase subunit
MAWETIRRIRHLGGGEPIHLFVSQCAAPQEIVPDDPPISERPESDIIEHLQKMGRVPQSMVRSALGRRMMLRAFLPDARIRDHWRYRRAITRLRTPTTVFAAENDTRVSVVQMSEWGEQTTSRPLNVYRFPGNHFAVYDPGSPACTAIAKALAS